MAARKQPDIRTFVERGRKAQAAVNAILRKPHHGTASPPAPARPSAMTVDELKRVAGLLYGGRQVNIAEALGTNIRIVRFYIAGGRPIPVKVRERLREIVAERRQELAELDGWL